MADSFDYGSAYEQVGRDLKNAIAERDRLEMKITTLRQTLTALAASCEQQGIEIEQSQEALYLLESSTLPDEILTVLRAAYPGYHRANTNKNKLELLGHDMSKYQNPLATIHMILKRQIEADKVESSKNKAGEKLFRVRKDWNVVPQATKGKKKKTMPFYGEI
jgi:endonuclease/exonuclease/phosphatase (EEP) superfamily protein YafD